MKDKIINLISIANKNIVKMNITGLPRLFLLIYAFLFVFFGAVYAVGIILEFYKTGIVNYMAITKFIGVFFSTATVATMVIIGKALIDEDKDGIPDNWEKDKKEVEK